MAVVLTDDFLWADGPLPAVSGGLYAKPTDWPNPISVLAHQAKGSSGDNAVYRTDLSPPAQWAAITLATLDAFQGPSVFNSGVGDFYLVQVQTAGSSWGLYRVRSNQQFTGIGLLSAPNAVVGTVARLDAELVAGIPVLTARSNGANAGTFVDLAAPRLLAGAPGFRLYDATVRVSRFQAGDTLRAPLTGTVRATGPTYHVFGPTYAAATGTVQIVLPADTALALVGIGGYHGTARGFSTDGAITIGAVASVGIPGDSSTAGWQAALHVLVAPPTGLQTLTWHWLGPAVDNQVILSVTCWTGVAASTPVRDSAGAQSKTTSQTTRTLAAQPGDRIVAWNGAYAPSIDATWAWTGVSPYEDFGTRGNSDAAWGTTLAAGPTTVTGTGSGSTTSEGGLAAVVLAPAVVSPGGGALDPGLSLGLEPGAELHAFPRLGGGFA
jgi:hypothetical protein